MVVNLARLGSSPTAFRPRLEKLGVSLRRAERPHQLAERRSGSARAR